MPDADDAPPLLSSFGVGALADAADGPSSLPAAAPGAEADAADGPSSLPAAAPGTEADASDVFCALARLAAAFALSSKSMVSGFFFVGGLVKASTLVFWGLNFLDSCFLALLLLVTSNVFANFALVFTHCLYSILFVLLGDAVQQVLVDRPHESFELGEAGELVLHLSQSIHHLVVLLCA